MTFNINWGGPRADLSARAILEIGADIVCLQETTPAWEDYLRPMFAARYPHMIFRHGRGAGGMAVFSRWPVREMARATPPAGWFFGWVLGVETPAGEVQVLVVHLKPSLSDSGTVSLGAYLSASGRRREEIRFLHGLLDPGKPTLVLGDFNEGDGGSAVKWLVEQGFADALREFDPGGRTWRWPTRFWTFTDRFDHVLYSPELFCCRAAAVRSGASDHFPVAAVFENAAARKRPAPPPAGPPGPRRVPQP
jgi:endonuclease/exonuclease/phosphatase family metal-dependent hydrolase